MTLRRSHGDRRAASPRERLEHSAYRLFTRHGIRAVGVDTIVAQSGATKMTLYRHYRSKSALAVAFLKRRREAFSRAWQAQACSRARTPRGRLLAVFDVLGEWFEEPGFGGCPVIKESLELDGREPDVRRAVLEHFDFVRGFFRELAREAGIRDAETFARDWHSLMKASVADACAGDRTAARRAKAIGRLLLRAKGAGVR